MALDALTLLKTEGPRAAAVARGAITHPSVDGMLSSPLPSAVVAVSSEVVRSFCLFTSVLVFSWPVGATSAPCGEMKLVLGLSTGGREETSVGRKGSIIWRLEITLDR